MCCPSADGRLWTQQYCYQCLFMYVRYAYSTYMLLYSEYHCRHAWIATCSLTPYQFHVRNWVGYCDVAMLLYETDPMKPDPVEIAKVKDYVVAYASKGNSALAIEKHLVSQFIMK